jgi:stage V sporulation protein R
MELISQHTKEIMEGCKGRAREAGLRFENETLEYIVTNRDLLELSPKLMIPTLYDYWVHDVEVLRERGKYELYPSNPYETVINTRPAISFYNDNNPDWLNVMIFYHVLGHIDFFQSNHFFRNTWDYDFTGQALSDKRLIAKLRSDKGRWVDYVIEFSRGIDNLAGYHQELSRVDRRGNTLDTKQIDFYFDVFLQSVQKMNISQYVKEVERYNTCIRKDPHSGERAFFAEVYRKYSEFQTLFEKHVHTEYDKPADLIQYIMENSDFLKRNENRWMKSVIQVVRTTSLFFQPQIRTKIMNEGWASYWHEKLFLQDDRIKGHEIDFARVHSSVASLPRVGLNPYALGMRLFSYIEELGDKGKHSMEFRRLADAHQRKKFDRKHGKGNDLIFTVRENLCDFTFISTFVDQDFVDRHELFVVGKRLNQGKMVMEYYVKGRSADAYKAMLLDKMYHPPCIELNREKSQNGELYLVHLFEEKPLVKDYIPNTMLGIEYLWGAPVHLETNEPVSKGGLSSGDEKPSAKKEIAWQRVLYTMSDRKLSKKNLA